MAVLKGQLVLPDRVMPGRIVFDDCIECIGPLDDAPDRLIVPGFIDPHVHGGGGGDTIDGPDGIAILARFHLRHGTTTLLPTTITRPWSEVMAMLDAVRVARDARWPGAADIPGAHLEGPFISPERLGAQPPFALDASPDLVAQAIGTGIIRVVTLAPEIIGADAAATAFVRADIRISLGHSQADHARATQSLRQIQALGGVAGATHLFNAMTGITGRAPGLAGAMLLSLDAHAELILDNHHVDPATFRLACAMMGNRLLLVTDAMRAAGLGDCDSELGGEPVRIRNGSACRLNGTLAGSVLTMDQAFRNAVSAGLSLSQASQLTSANAARYLGLGDRGALAPGLRADFVELTPRLGVSAIWLWGRRCSPLAP